MQQLVLFEVAVSVLLCAWVVGPALLGPAGMTAALLVVLAVVRRRRRSLPAWLATVVAFRVRNRRAAARVPVAGPGAGSPVAPLTECVPGLRTCSFTHRDRRPVGMAVDGTHLTVVVRVDAEDTVLRADRTARPLPPGLVRDVMDVDGIRLESARIVQHTRPAPAPHLPGDAVATLNYAPLQARTGSPAVRLTWVTLTLDPELCPEAVRMRGGGLTGARRCLLRAADQLSGRLTGAGFGATVLTEQELGAALATAVCADVIGAPRADGTAPPARRTRETSRTWSCDGRRHTVYWVRRWPRSGDVPMARLVALLTSVPAPATTFSLTLARGDRQEVAAAGHLRISARTDEELRAARRALERVARGARVSLVRLDREQLPGVLATLPLGGAH
ncbi:type VII secretion protein EccE [Streptomyces sp. NBC_00441]|uniref:type VII secretion protein EccE n=1 Tax=Streptomyces sp. NBC_00441 TaxID=2975742 RepID=UPI002E2AF422|nr:type VII secretion protein EccE [Streptomyces sp. NBC_00441]